MKKYILAAIILLPVSVWAVYLFVKANTINEIKEPQVNATLELDSSARASLKRQIDPLKQSRNEEAELEADSLIEAITSKQDEKTENNAAAKEMLIKVMDAASRGDRAFLNEIPKNDPNCSWCNAYYGMAIDAIRSGDLRSDMRAFLALSLTQSGKPANVRAVVDAFQAAANSNAAVQSAPAQAQQVSASQNNPSAPAPIISDSSMPPDSDPAAMSILGRALEGADLNNSDVDAIAASLNSENPYEREAAVSILTRQGSLEAAQELYRHTVEMGDPSGYYRSGMGIGNMVPEAEAIPFLEGMAKSGDDYSHLAVKALLNSGSEGIEKVITLLNQSHDAISARKLLRSAVDHIPHDRATMARMQELSASSTNTAVQELAKAVIREKEIEDNSSLKQIEFNDNFEAGLVENDPVPQE